MSERWVEPHLLQGRLGFEGPRCWRDTMHDEWFSHEMRDTHPRIKRAIGVLKNHLHALTQWAHGPCGERSNISALKKNVSSAWFDEFERESTQGTFAASCFTYQAECFARIE